MSISEAVEISQLINLAFGLMFVFFPVERLSKIVTSIPCSISLSTKLEPIKPAPPVTIAFFILYFN